MFLFINHLQREKVKLFSKRKCFYLENICGVKVFLKLK